MGVSFSPELIKVLNDCEEGDPLCLGALHRADRAPRTQAGAVLPQFPSVLNSSGPKRFRKLLGGPLVPNREVSILFNPFADIQADREKPFTGCSEIPRKHVKSEERRLQSLWEAHSKKPACCGTKWFFPVYGCSSLGWAGNRRQPSIVLVKECQGEVLQDV